MISWLARVLLVVSGAVTEWFVAPDSLNFKAIQATMAILVFTLMVFVLVFWPKLVATPQSYRQQIIAIIA